MRIKRALTFIAQFLSPKKGAKNEETPFSSSDYWEQRYLSGDNSGIGSYGRLAQFKAATINQFVKKNKIKTVIEWGCGDGNQLTLANYPLYTGFDVSKEAVRICTERFKGDLSKKFFYCGSPNFTTSEKAELVLSLDVIYHLIEDDVFSNYMKQLFDSSLKYVCIYSCNDEEGSFGQHVKHRKFTNWIDQNIASNWTLIEHIPNQYPYNPNEEETSWSDFFFYLKKDSHV